MVINQKLKTALLDRLGVTSQRLSQRITKLKKKSGPMSSEDAAYVIAHLEGFDLTRYLKPETVDRIRGLLPRSQTKSSTGTKQKEGKQRQSVTTIRIGSDLSQIDALLSATITKDAQNMAEVYPKYYVLENSIRIVIKRILEKTHGKDWWTTTVASDVQNTVADRKREEAKQPWHGKRGQHEIFYSDFKDLRKIIQKNWKDFKDLFPSQPWITQKLVELEHPRNVMAHHNPVSRTDLKRIELYFDDWLSLLKDRKDLIP